MLCACSGPDCISLFNASSVALFGTGPICLWETTTSLLVFFGLSPIFELSDSLYVLTGAIMDSNEQVMVPALELMVSVPDVPPSVIPVVSGSVEIGVCDDAVLDAVMSYGNAGRAFVYSWSFDKSLNSGLNSSVILVKLCSF